MNGITKYLSIGIFIILVLKPFSGISQNYNIDSLKLILSKCKEDSNKINNLLYISEVLRQTKPDSAIKLLNNAMEIAKDLKWNKGLVNSQFMLGKIYYLKSDYPIALDYYLKSLKLAETLDILSLQGSIVSSIANIYLLQANYAKALEKYFMALKISTKLNNKPSIASLYSSIGLTYTYKNETKKALEYLLKSLQLNKELGNEIAVAKALDFIGYTYSVMGDYQLALNYLDQSLKINERSGSKIRILDNLRNMGEVYITIGKYKEAEIALKKALMYSDSIGHMRGIEAINLDLSNLYDSIKKPKLAFEHFKKYIIARDSIASDENQKKQIRTEMNYEFEKKEAIIKEKQEKERLIAQEKNRFQQIVIWSAVIGLLIVLVFALFIFKTLKTTRFQKRIIEEKQKEILDSIHYAKRIQTSLLPSEKYIDKNLNKHG